MVVQRVDYTLQFVAKGNKVDHVMVFIERAFHFDGNAIVVPVQPLANIPVKRDEMGSAKDMLLLFQANTIWHPPTIATAAAICHPGILRTGPQQPNRPLSPDCGECRLTEAKNRNRTVLSNIPRPPDLQL